jgi:hypothetical protein
LALQSSWAAGGTAFTIINALVCQIAPSDQGRLFHIVNVAFLVTFRASASPSPIWTVEIVGGIVTAGEGNPTIGIQADLLLAHARVGVASVDHTFHGGTRLNAYFWECINFL